MNFILCYLHTGYQDTKKHLELLSSPIFNKLPPFVEGGGGNLGGARPAFIACNVWKSLESLVGIKLKEFRFLLEHRNDVDA